MRFGWNRASRFCSDRGIGNRAKSKWNTIAPWIDSGCDPFLGRVDPHNLSRETATRGLDDRSAKCTHVIARASKRNQEEPRKNLTIVIDGSIGMFDHLEAVVQSLTSLPPAVEVQLLVASDSVPRCIGISRATLYGSDRYSDGSPQVRCRDWRLRQRPGIAAGMGHGGPNCIRIRRLGPCASLSVLDSGRTTAQMFERRPDRVTLYDVQVEAGPNRIIDELKAVAAIRRCSSVRGPPA